MIAKRFLGVEPCLVADGDERILHLLLDREVDFAPRIVELALLAQHIRLGLLRRCELLAVGGENLLHLRQPLVAFAEFVGQRQTGPLSLRFGDPGTLGLQLRRHALVDGFPGFRKLLLGLPQLGFALAELFLLVRKLSLEAPLGLRDQRGGKGLVSLIEVLQFGQTICGSVTGAVLGLASPLVSPPWSSLKH